MSSPVAELQRYTVFAASVGSAAKDRAAAKVVDALATPSAAALFNAKGLEPIPR
jgi:hypothetical protein